MQPRVAAAATPSASWENPARGIRSLVRMFNARMINVRLIKPALKTLIPASWLRQFLHHRSRRWDARFHSQPAVDVFTAIYKEAKWGAGRRGNYYSGSGSHDPQVVRPYVEAVSAFLQSLPTPPSLVDL